MQRSVSRRHSQTHCGDATCTNRDIAPYAYESHCAVKSHSQHTRTRARDIAVQVAPYSCTVSTPVRVPPLFSSGMLLETPASMAVSSWSERCPTASFRQKSASRRLGRRLLGYRTYRARKPEEGEKKEEIGIQEARVECTLLVPCVFVPYPETCSGFSAVKRTRGMPSGRE